MSLLWYCVYGFIAIFAIKLIFWDIPKHFSYYWRGVFIGALGIGAAVGLTFLYSNYLAIGLMLTPFALFGLLMLLKKTA